MATVTLTRTATCPAGGHHTLALTGDLTGTKVYDMAALQEIFDRATRENLVAAILRLAKSGRTWAQVTAMLDAGITVTI